MRKLSMILTAVAGVMVFGGCASEKTPDGPISVETTYEKISFAGEKATDAERAKCDAVGGKVMRTGMAGWEHCIQDMADAGETCSDSSECTSKCLIPPQESREYSPGEAATGVCAQTDTIFGCVTFVTDGKAEHTLCID